MYHGWARWALATQLHGEHSVLWTTGVVPEHKAVLLPRCLLRASDRLRSRAPRRSDPTHPLPARRCRTQR
jgi:hypothetical protein